MIPILSVCCSGNRWSAAVVSYKNIPVWGWHCSGTNSPYIPMISRCVAAYIAARGYLMRDLHCYKLPRYMYLPTNLACRAEWNFNRQWRANSTSSMCCSKIIQPIYQILKTSIQTYHWCIAWYHRNLANRAYLFLYLKKTAITYGQQCTCCLQ